MCTTGDGKRWRLFSLEQEGVMINTLTFTYRVMWRYGEHKILYYSKLPTEALRKYRFWASIHEKCILGGGEGDRYEGQIATLTPNVAPTHPFFEFQHNEVAGLLC